MNTADIWISSEHTQKVVSILEVILSTEVVLNMKIRNYHWNIISPHFSELHKFFEDMYEESTETIDDIAERMRSLWEIVDGNYKNFLSKSLIKEETENATGAETMIKWLLQDKETIIKAMRKDITHIAETTHDIGTEDFLTWLLQAHEKNAWMLRSMV